MKKKLIASGAVLLALTLGAALAQDKGGKGGKGAARKVREWPCRRRTSRTAASFPTSSRKPFQCPSRRSWNGPTCRLPTASFVLIMHDPDNALNKTPDDVLHWMVFNIPGTARGLAGGQPTDAKLPDGTIQAKGIRNVGYMGPGNAAINPYHHYTLELYALDSMLTLGPDATRAEVMTAMTGHIVGKAVLVGRFKRPQ